MAVRSLLTPPATGDTVDGVVDYYYRYLARNRDLAVHFEQFKKRLKADAQAATAEAIVFSYLRAEKLQPELFEDPSSGGPDFRCNPTAPFLVEVTSLDSAVVAKRSGLPATITGPGGGAFGLITDRLFSEAKNKAPQLGRHPLPGVLAIVSGHAFSSILLDRLAAEYLMTSAPQFSVPLGGGPHSMTTDLKHAVFYRPLGVLDASGTPIITPCRQSIAAILLIAIYRREVQIVGLVHPEAAYPFNSAWMAKVPFVQFEGQCTPNHIATEWIETASGERVATFPHRRIQYFS
jgi:hypothetical protein